jgi:hypothetical protein
MISHSATAIRFFKTTQHFERQISTEKTEISTESQTATLALLLYFKYISSERMERFVVVAGNERMRKIGMKKSSTCWKKMDSKVHWNKIKTKNINLDFSS